jgi:hypothetical protein
MSANVVPIMSAKCVLSVDPATGELDPPEEIA